MHILVCENNLVGFLTAVYHSYYTFQTTDVILSDPQKVTLLDQSDFVAEDVGLAQKVRAGIVKTGGQGIYRDVRDAYLNNHPDKEQIIYQYLKLFFKYGRKVTAMFDREEIVRFHDLYRKVRGETHRLSGFIRLQEMENGTFYGYFVSDHDILELLFPQFRPQFNAQKFILHDIKRKKIIYFDGKKAHKMLAPDQIEITLSEQEVMFQSLWKQYFQTVTIKERENPRLQRHFLPKKYRFFMHEF